MGRTLLPAQMGRHSCPQFSNAEGLGEVVVPAQPQAGENIGLLGFCREEQDGTVRQRPDPAAEGEPILPRHHHIQQDAVRPAAGCLVHLTAGEMGGHLVSIPLQSGLQQGTEIFVVIYHQDMGHGRSPQFSKR